MANHKSSFLKSIGSNILKPFHWFINNPTIKLLILMGLILSVFTTIGIITSLLISDIAVVLISFTVGALINLGIYWFSDKLIVLLTGAKNVDNDPKFAHIKQTIKELTDEANILDHKLNMKIPKLYFMQDRANAFATGRNPQNGLVCVTSDLLKLFDINKREDQQALKAILAHEISHIRHRDIFFMTSVAVVMNLMETVSKTAFYRARSNLLNNSGKKDNNVLANLGLFTTTLILSTVIMPVAKLLGTCFLSRTREYGADRGAFELMHDEKPMIRALRKLQQHVASPEFAPSSSKDKSKLSRFDGVKAMCLSPDEVLTDSKPGKKSNFIIRFFKWIANEGISTHPTFDNRVRALEELAADQTKSQVIASSDTKGPQMGKPLYYGYQPTNSSYPSYQTDQYGPGYPTNIDSQKLPRPIY